MIDGGVSDVVILSSVLKLAFGFLAVIVVFGLLRLLDRLSGVTFSSWMYKASRSSDYAVAIYFGLRFVGVCMLVGSIIQ